MMKLLVLALCLVGVTLGNTLLSRGVDGGEGEFNSACALEGYYQFSSSNVIYFSVDGGCCDGPPSPSQMTVHFYRKGGKCHANVLFSTWIEYGCETNIIGGVVESNSYQFFDGDVYDLEVFALSQSKPTVLLTSTGCMSRTQMTGVLVEDINTAALKNCQSYNSHTCNHE